jgi:hypothetical protein
MHLVAGWRLEVLQNRKGAVVESQPPLFYKPEDRRGRDRFRNARDPKSMRGPNRNPRSSVCETVAPCQYEPPVVRNSEADSRNVAILQKALDSLVKDTDG